MPSLRSALGPPGRPFGDGLSEATASDKGAAFCRSQTTKQRRGFHLIFAAQWSKIGGRRMPSPGPEIRVSFPNRVEVYVRVDSPSALAAVFREAAQC